MIVLSPFGDGLVHRRDYSLDIASVFGCECPCFTGCAADDGIVLGLLCEQEQPAHQSKNIGRGKAECSAVIGHQYDAGDNAQNADAKEDLATIGSWVPW